MYPICPVGSVATCFEVFWIIVAQMSGFLSLKTSIKLKVVQNLVAKSGWYCREEVVLGGCKKNVIILLYWKVCNFRRLGF